MIYAIIAILEIRKDYHMGNLKTKKLVQGAMIAAIFGALSVFNTYTGSLFDIFICYAMVIPLVWFGYTYRWQDNLLVSFVAMIVIIITGLPFFAISSFSSCLAGVFLAEALKRQAPRTTLLLGTLAVTFLNNILLYEVFSGLLNMDLIGEMKGLYVSINQIMPSLSQNISLSAFLSLAPLVLMLVSAMEMYVIILLCQLTLPRLQIPFPNSFHISQMHISRPIGFVLIIIVLIGYLVKDVMHLDMILITYLFYMALIALALEGLAFLSWLAIMKNKSFFILLAFLGLMIPVVNSLYVVIGIIDIFSDLRGNILYNKHNEQ